MCKQRGICLQAHLSKTYEAQVQQLSKKEKREGNSNYLLEFVAYYFHEHSFHLHAYIAEVKIYWMSFIACSVVADNPNVFLLAFLLNTYPHKRRSLFLFRENLANCFFVFFKIDCNGILQAIFSVTIRQSKGPRRHDQPNTILKPHLNYCVEGSFFVERTVIATGALGS